MSIQSTIRALLAMMVLGVLSINVQAERPSLQSLQDQIDQLQAQVNAIPAVGEKKYQLVGFSSGTHTGGLGLIEFAKLCQQDYPESRMCTTQEVADSPTVPAGLPAGNAWVRPILRDDSSGFYDLTTGISRNPVYELNCGFWKVNTAYLGVVVNNSGGFGESSCATNNYIACCAPAP